MGRVDSPVTLLNDEICLRDAFHLDETLLQLVQYAPEVLDHSDVGTILPSLTFQSTFLTSNGETEVLPRRAFEVIGVCANTFFAICPIAPNAVSCRTLLPWPPSGVNIDECKQLETCFQYTYKKTPNGPRFIPHQRRTERTWDPSQTHDIGLDQNPERCLYQPTTGSQTYVPERAFSRMRSRSSPARRRMRDCWTRSCTNR